MSGSLFKAEGSPPDPALPSIWKRMPNTAFGIGMGLGGQAILWGRASQASYLPEDVPSVFLHKLFWFMAVIITAVISGAYIFKAVTNIQWVKDEFRDGTRIHFFNMPNLIMIMLTMSCPRDLGMSVSTKRALFALGVTCQALLSQYIYSLWMFSPDANVSAAKPPFLLSTVGWLLLACLGDQTRIEETWGVAIPSFCFGAGMIFYAIIANSIFSSIHKSPKARGAPALFLLIAPPSVAVVSMDVIVDMENRVNLFSETMFGFCLILLLVLYRLGPKITPPPPMLGFYWPYVFPLAALATASIRLAYQESSRSMEFLSSMLILQAAVVFAAVTGRMVWHITEVSFGRAMWLDPLLKRRLLEDGVEGVMGGGEIA